MPPPLRVSLDPGEQTELERRSQTTRDATTRTRYQIVLLAAQGHTPPQIALLVRCSADTVRRVLKRYLAGGPDAVPHRPHLGQPPHWWSTSSGVRHEAPCYRVGCETPPPAAATAG